jgi:hypothetical protein
MGANAGPDIVSDGLVLALDAADNNSFRGEPTTNVVSNSQPTTGWGVSLANSTYPDVTCTRQYLVESGVSFIRLTNVTYNSGYPRVTDTVFANSATITGTFAISFEARGTDGARLDLKIYEGGSTKVTATAYLTPEWTRYTFTRTTGFNLTRPYIVPVTTGATYDITNIQIEAKPSATRFTTGTRGTTVATGGGWADISGNDNHGEILNGTTTSNDGSVLGALDFDGTNDYLSIATTNLNNLTEGSFEFWFKSSTTGPLIGFFTDIENYFTIWTGDSTGFWSDESIRVIYRKEGTYFYNYAAREGNSYYADNNWHQCVFTVDGNGNKLYTNGSLLSVEQWGSSTEGNSSTRWLNDLSPSIIALARRVDNYTNVEIASVKFYNRALTASEILANYNSLKTRFGL